MARLPRPSAASYATFKNLAWQQLSPPLNAALTVRQQTDLLYNNCYTPSLDPALPPKVALAGYDLYHAMEGICNGAGAVREVKRQRSPGPWPVLNTTNLAAEYRAWANYEWWQPVANFFCGLINNPLPVALTHNAQRAMGAYLHIYATGGRVENNNWRIAFNIQPSAIPAAVAAMCPVLDNNNDIGHFKVSAPGTVGKPDSLIVYMRNNPLTYAGIRVAVLNAVGGLAMQQTFAPMWNEFALGQGEGGEPPRVSWNAGANQSGMSFGTYRCLLTVKAFQDALVAYGGLAHVTQANFNMLVDQTFNTYGLPIATPHNQQALNFLAATPANVEFMQTYALYKGQAAGYFTGARAGVLADR